MQGSQEKDLSLSEEFSELSGIDNKKLKESNFPIASKIIGMHKDRSISYNPPLPSIKNFVPHLRPSKPKIVLPLPFSLNNTEKKQTGESETNDTLESNDSVNEFDEDIQDEELISPENLARNRAQTIASEVDVQNLLTFSNAINSDNKNPKENNERKRGYKKRISMREREAEIDFNIRQKLLTGVIFKKLQESSKDLTQFHIE